MCLSVLPACVYVYHVYAWYPWSAEEGIGFQHWSYEGLEAIIGLLGLNVGPLQEHQVLLTTEPSLQLQ